MFARYAKYIGYYTKKYCWPIPFEFARYAKYIGYYTVAELVALEARFARYAKYIGYYTKKIIQKHLTSLLGMLNT